MSYLYPRIGLYLHPDNSYPFIVWAPQKSDAQLVVERGGVRSSHPMTRDERGFWRVTTTNISPGSRYGFSVENGPVLPDPASRSQPEGRPQLQHPNLNGVIDSGR